MDYVKALSFFSAWTLLVGWRKEHPAHRNLVRLYPEHVEQVKRELAKHGSAVKQPREEEWKESNSKSTYNAVVS